MAQDDELFEDSSMTEPVELTELPTQRPCLGWYESRKNARLGGKTFFPPGRSETQIALAMVTLGSILVPLCWGQTAELLKNVLAISILILASSTNLMFAVLGGGLIVFPLALGILYFYLQRWLNSFTEADRILLNDEGITVYWSAQPAKLLRWTDITSVFLFRPEHTMMPGKWLVGFGTTEARPVNIRHPVAAALGPELLALLKTHCKWASIDPDLIELWEPALADSRTELWLKSLSKAPKESELVPLFPGDTLKNGRYTILSLIGVGGQGTAYLAKDKESEAEVVVKENLFPVFVDADVRAQAEGRYKQEVELLGQLSNEQIVSMLDSFMEAHRGYLVFNYINGDSLRKLVKKRAALPETEVVQLAQQMAEMLKYLHGLSPPVIHRDFTPDNLLLDQSGKLILIDFNVARQMVSTKTATVVGKHAYIPPEQFRGEADTRSDIYAFGATLFFLLIGEDPEPIAQSFPAQLNPELSEKIDQLVSKATAQNLADRFQSASELLKHLNP